MSENNNSRGIGHWFSSMARVFSREWKIIFSDMGVMIFFILLPLAYPVVYTLIYNPEVVNDMPVAVVDHSRTAMSRTLVQTAEASPAIMIYAQCADMQEAKELFAENKVFGIMEIPADFDKCIGRGEVANVPFYFQMSLLLRYRTFLSALADIQLKAIGDITSARLEATGAEALGLGSLPVDTQSQFLGDPGQGFASFVMPGVLVLIIQQSLVLGICMLRGTSNERRRRNRGFDPLQVENAPASATLLGKAFCYFVLYMPLVLYVVKCMPEMFALPHQGHPVDYLLFLVPYMFASIMFGFILANLCTERESAFLIIVVSSVVFLFLSGLTWPRYAMNPLWRGVGALVPGTWAVEGFIRINSNGATLGECSYAFYAMWIQATAYFIIAWGLMKYWLAPVGARRVAGQS